MAMPAQLAAALQAKGGAPGNGGGNPFQKAAKRKLKKGVPPNLKKQEQAVDDSGAARGSKEMAMEKMLGEKS